MVEIAAVITTGLVAVAVTGLGVYYLIRLERRLTRLESENQHLKDAQGKRIPYGLREQLENAMFAIGTYKRNIELDQASLDNAQAWIKKMME